MIFGLNTSGIYSAPAKINLHLYITDILTDGRHALDTSFIFVDCCDVLHIKASPMLSVRCSENKLSGEHNLVFQILHALREKEHIQQGLDIFIDKKLPSQAGLGGGSSDAATALMVANAMWHLNYTTEQLIGFATPFGADIPCFLFGQASLAQGVGEQLCPYPETFTDSYVCLAKPISGLSTKGVFQQFDSMLESQKINALNIHSQSPLTPSISADKMRAASQGKVAIGENMLEKSAQALLPEIEPLLHAMRQQASLAWMSGSGSTCVALCSSLQNAEQLANHLQHSGQANWTHAGRLLSRHPAFEDNNGA